MPGVGRVAGRQHIQGVVRGDQLTHRLHRRQQLSQPRLILRMLADQLLDIDTLTGLQPLGHPFQQFAQRQIFANA